MILNKPWHNGADLGAIVQESHASLSIESYPGYILNPVPLIKGVGIQEGSLCLAFYTLGVLSWTPSVGSPLFEEPGLPSLAPSPLFGLNVILF